MKIIWSPDSAYRCFYSSPAQRIDLVSSCLAQDAGGYVVTDVLTLVVDREGAFCDLEMVLLHEIRIMNPILMEAPVRVEGAARTDIGDSVKVTWFLSDDLDTLVIGLSPEAPTKWLEICEGVLYLGVNHLGQLGAIASRKVEIDPDGALQGHWLDSLEAELGRTGHS